jgi:hypothetical protein
MVSDLSNSLLRSRLEGTGLLHYNEKELRAVIREKV